MVDVIYVGMNILDVIDIIIIIRGCYCCMNDYHACYNVCFYNKKDSKSLANADAVLLFDSRSRSSLSVSLRWHLWHNTRRFSSSLLPPLHRGIIWCISIFSFDPQFSHLYPRCFNTILRI